MNYNGDTVTAVIVGALVYLVVLAAIYVWISIALSKVFAKFGIPAWKAWVPFVNTIELLRLGGYEAWNIIWFFVPVLNMYGIVLVVISVHRINQRFGFGTGMTVLGALVFPVWASILGFGQRQLLGAADRRFADIAAGAVGGQPPSVKSALNPFGVSTVSPTGPMVSAPRGFQPSTPVPVPASPSQVSREQTDSSLAPPSPSPAMIAESLAPGAPAVSAAAAPPAVTEQSPWARAASPTLAETPQQPAVTILPPPAPDLSASAAPEGPSTGTVAQIIPPAPIAVPPALRAAAPTTTATATATASEDDDDEDRTIVVNRKPVIQWTLVSSTGERLPLASDEVVLGRKPIAADGGFPLAVPDPTKTLSRVHARLSRLDDVWTITDLNATNGVVVIDAEGVEKVLDAGASAAVITSFILGKLRLSIEFDAAGSTQ